MSDYERGFRDGARAERAAVVHHVERIQTDNVLKWPLLVDLYGLGQAMPKRVTMGPKEFHDARTG